MELLVFDVARQRYALPLSQVEEVARAVAITPLPGAPAIIEGVIDVRGRVVPVLDLRSRFVLPPKPLELGDQLVVARVGERLVALRVDAVGWPRRVRPEDIEDVADVAPGTPRIAGIGKLPDGLVLIHDLAAFLSQAEAEGLAAALESLDAEPRA